MKTFPTWKTLTFCVYPTGDDLSETVESSGSQIPGVYRKIVARLTLAKEPVKYELVRASGRDLGITAAARRTTIIAMASKYGLDNCPPELGPQLRRQYQDQRKGEVLWIAMDPIEDADALIDEEDLHVFCVGHEGGDCCLTVFDGNPGILWHPDHVWVFARRKAA